MNVPSEGAAPTLVMKVSVCRILGTLFRLIKLPKRLWLSLSKLRIYKCRRLCPQGSSGALQEAFLVVMTERDHVLLANLVKANQGDATTASQCTAQLPVKIIQPKISTVSG